MIMCAHLVGSIINIYIHTYNKKKKGFIPKKSET